MSTTSSDSDPTKRAKAAQFEGFGTNFKGKLIGIEDVPEARGDKMCQIAMAKLKAGVRAAGDHKPKVTINVSIDGVKIIDDRTGAVQHTHPVQHISFILRDTTDSRAFGYVCGKGNGTSHQFFGIKTERAADPLVFCLRDLFEVAFEKKKQDEVKKPEEETTTVATDVNKNEVEKKDEEKEQTPSENLFSFDSELKSVEKNLDGVNVSGSGTDDSWMMTSPWENKPAPAPNQSQQNALQALMAAGAGSQQMMFTPSGFGQTYPQPVVMAFGGYPVATTPVYRVPAPTGIMVSSPFPPGSWPPPGAQPPPRAMPPQPTQPSPVSWASFNSTSAGPPQRSDPFDNDPFFTANHLPMQPLSAAGRTPVNGSPVQPKKQPSAFDPFADLTMLQAELSQKKMDKSAFTKEEPKPTLMDLSQQKPVTSPTNPFGSATPGVSLDTGDSLGIDGGLFGSPINLTPAPVSGQSGFLLQAVDAGCSQDKSAGIELHTALQGCD